MYIPINAKLAKYISANGSSGITSPAFADTPVSNVSLHFFPLTGFFLSGKLQASIFLISVVVTKWVSLDLLLLISIVVKIYAIDLNV